MFLLLVGMAFSQDGLTVEINSIIKNVKTETINSEVYIPFEEFTTIMKIVDQSVEINWDTASGNLSIKIQGKNISLSTNAATIIIDETMLNTKYPLLVLQGNIMIPESTLLLISKFLENIVVNSGDGTVPTTETPKEQNVYEKLPELVEEVNTSEPVSNGSTKKIAIYAISQGDDDTAALNTAKECKQILDNEGSINAQLFDFGNNITDDQIVDKINTSGAKMCLIIKTESSQLNDASGIKIFCMNSSIDKEASLYEKDLKTSSRIPNNFNYLHHQQQSQALAKTIEKEITSSLPDESQGIRSAPIYILKRLDMPSIMIELGNLSNDKDSKNLQESAHLSAQARALSGGILKYKE